MIAEAAAAFLLVFGTFFMAVGSIGLLRMPDLYTRMHAITKAATLGIAGLVTGAIVALGTPDVAIKGVLAIVFQFLTNPVGAHMVARAAYHHLKVPFWENTFLEEWKEQAGKVHPEGR